MSFPRFFTCCWWPPLLGMIFVGGSLPATEPQAGTFRVLSGKCDVVSNSCEVSIEGAGLAPGAIGNKAAPTVKDASPAEPALSFEYQPSKTKNAPVGTRT